MRTPEDLCFLCLKEKATQTNSHIVSKFIGKGILGTKGPRKGFLLDAENPDKPEQNQDTAKEDFILCPSCENYFQVLETYISENLHKRILFDKYNNDFSYKKNPGNLSYAVCHNVDSLIFRLFFISIYWRCSIASVRPFTDFKIKEEEVLRQDLIKHGTQKIADLLGKAVDQTLINRPLVVIRSRKGKDQTYNYLFDRILDDGTYFLGLNEYLTFFGINETSLTRKFGSLTNKENNPIIIIADDKMWSSFTAGFIEFYQYQVKSRSNVKKDSGSDKDTYKQ